MNAPLYHKLKEYAKKPIKRFFMPSHAGKKISPLYRAANFDFTELSFSDNLINPTGIICEAQKLLAKNYGADKSLIFTSGATSAIMSAVGVISEKTKEVLVDSFSHKSVFSALDLFNLNVTLLKREYDNEGFPKKIDTLRLNELLSKNEKIKAVLITSPDYFGNTSDIIEIAKIVHDHGAILFVDEAQGAHFAFSKFLPQNAAKYADIVCDSLHKTLPVYGGGAVLNVKEEFDDLACYYRSKLCTSSPSYLTMASIDFARDFYDKKGNSFYNKILKEVTIAKAKLKDKVKASDDFSRFVVKCDCDYLEKHGFFAEMQWGSYGVFILNPFNIRHLKRLIKLVQCSPIKNGIDGKELNELKLPQTLTKVYGQKEFIPLNKAEGRICGAYVGCYPPGVPILYEGEIITKEKIEFLKGKNIFNLAYNKICVIIK